MDKLKLTAGVSAISSSEFPPPHPTLLAAVCRFLIEIRCGINQPKIKVTQ